MDNALSIKGTITRDRATAPTLISLYLYSLYSHVDNPHARLINMEVVPMNVVNFIVEFTSNVAAAVVVSA